MLEPLGWSSLDTARLPGPGTSLVLPVVCVYLGLVTVKILLQSVHSFVKLDLFARILPQLFEDLFWFEEFISPRIQFRIVANRPELSQSIGSTENEGKKRYSVLEMSIVDYPGKK